MLARVARPEDADSWLAEATRRTVRQMKQLVLDLRGTADAVDLEEEAMRTLTLTVPREDAWSLERAKLLARHLNEGPEGTDAEVMLALIAESTSTLCGELPRTAVEPADDHAMEPQRAWERELARMRVEAETRCDARFSRDEATLCAAERLHWPEAHESIDRQPRELSRG